MLHCGDDRFGPKVADAINKQQQTNEDLINEIRHLRALIDRLSDRIHDLEYGETKIDDTIIIPYNSDTMVYCHTCFDLRRLGHIYHTDIRGDHYCCRTCFDKSIGK